MRYVALLRAVNVGGAKVPMAQLREVCAGLGWREVETYIQSGNVAFESEAAAPALAVARDAGGGRRVREVGAGRGWREVEAYIQSGNVVFESEAAAPELELALEQAVERHFGLKRPVMGRSAHQWGAAVAGRRAPGP